MYLSLHGLHLNLNAPVKSLTLNCTYLLKQSPVYWLILNTIRLTEVFICIVRMHFLEHHLANLGYCYSAKAIFFFLFLIQLRETIKKRKVVRTIRTYQITTNFQGKCQ